MNFTGGLSVLRVSELNLDIDLEEWWCRNSFIHPSLKLSKFVEEILLQGTKNIIIFIDEIDSLLNLEFKDDFFAFIRSCYNKRTEKLKYRHLTIALLGVATPSDLIKDKNHTPFNIENRAIELTGFQLDEVKPLETALVEVADNPSAVMKEVLAWTGGQPFLTQWVCQLICTSGLRIAAFKETETVSEIINQRIVENWLARDKQQHLQTIRDRILNNEQLACKFLALYQQILQQAEIPADDSSDILQLRLSGLVVKQQGKLKVYNRIYKSVFNETWVASELRNLRPYTEAFLAWLGSNRHESHLLQGEDLRFALQWADGISLSEHDYQFISASQEREFAIGQQRALRQQRKAQQKLANVLHKTKLGMCIGLAVLALSIFGATTAELSRQATVKATQLEQAGVNALQQFSESNQIDALVSAMQAGRELKHLVKEAPLVKYPAYSPMFSLQTILLNIQEQNRIEFGSLNSSHDIGFSPDGKTLAYANVGDEEMIILWRDGTSITTFKGHNGTMTSISFSPDGQILVSGSADKTIKLSKSDGTLIKTLTEHEDGVNSVSFSPSGQTFASASNDKTIKLWKRDGTLIKTLTEHSDRVNSVIFSPSGQTFASASDDKTIKLWRSDGTFIKTLTGHEDGVSSVSFSPSGKTLASASSDGTIKLWKRDGTPITTIKGHSEPVYRVSFSPDGRNLASGDSGGNIKLWDANGKEVKTIIGHTGEIFSVRFSPDGRTLVSTGSDGIIKFWKLDSSPIKVFTREGQAVSFSPDGETLVSASHNKTIKLRKPDGTLIKTLTGRSGPVSSITFSPDGETLASAHVKGALKYWHRDGTNIITQALGDSATLTSVSFSPDGQILAAASQNKTIELLRRDRTSIATLTGHKDIVRSVSFRPDGQILASGSDDKTIKLWKRDGS